LSTITEFDSATLEILWSRLHGIAEDVWNTVLRTSFSTIIGAALDYGCAILDAEGNQLIHGAASLPLFNLALPSIGRDLICRYRGQIYPGDVFIGNDPWLCCGHLPDVAILTPVFKHDRLVAFAANVGHQADFGGAHGHNRVREVYEEGLFLPVMKLYERGERNETLFAVIAANVRTPELVLGDIEAQVTANEVGARRLLDLFDEYNLDDSSLLVKELQGRSEAAMREIIRDLPNGTYHAQGLSDSKGRPTRLAVALTVHDDEITIDWSGTGEQLESGGVNCTLAFTTGYSHYATKSILAPHIPHNEGSTRPIRVVAPEGSILNCTFPSAVNARGWTGWHIYPTLLQAYAQIVPERVMAGPGLLVFPRIVGSYPNGRGYNAPVFAGGGQGGSDGRDGMGGYIFPSTASGVSTEVFEAACPAIITEKEWVADSAGAGEHRGGPATRLTMRRLPGYEAPVRMLYTPIRAAVPAPSMFGGREGSLDVPRWNGEEIPPDSPIRRDGWLMFREESDCITFHAPSGAGWGDPRRRDQAAIAADIRRGLVTRDGAARDYGG
jgi:N-methylhydantoinase B/oxoprolinase/acetone carboxylase alpha subunit